MGADVTKAAKRSLPFRRNADTDTHVRNVSVGTTHGSFEIPESFRGQFVTLRADVNVWVFCTDAAGEEVDRTVSSGSASATQGRKIPSDTTEDWYLPAEATHLVHEADAAGTLELSLSSGAT